MEEENHIQDLIIANATGNISDKERDLLNKWVKESVANSNEYSRLTRICKRIDNLSEWDNINLDKAQNEFKNKVSKGRIFRNWFRLAASVAIIISICFVLLYSQKNKIEGDLITGIVPGRSKAILTLSNGSSLDLGIKNIQITEEYADVMLNSKASGEITYKKLSDASPKELQYNTIKVPRGGEYQLVLCDGTRVWLNSETTLKYPVSFLGNIREVQLIGEAYFEVAHDKNKPFIVNSEITKVKVLGTSFNFKAYRGEEYTAVTLAEGKVQVKVDKNSYMLIPGKQAIVNRSNKDARISEVDVERIISWRNGIFQFVDMPMEELVKSLCRWYDVDFEFTKEGLRYKRFSGAITKYRDIKYILNIIGETSEVKFKIIGKKIIVEEI